MSLFISVYDMLMSYFDQSKHNTALYISRLYLKPVFRAMQAKWQDNVLINKSLETSIYLSILLSSIPEQRVLLHP